MEHYFSKKQSSRFNTTKIKARLRGYRLVFHTAPGVFSKNRVDKGTRTLIEYMQVNPGDRILDMGSGYGPIGVVCAKLGAKAVLVDVNKRAARLSKLNLKENNVNGRVVRSDFYEKISGEFDIILSNPPISAGRDDCFKIIRGAPQHLEKSGSLQIVARHHHGGKALHDEMRNVFGNVKVLGKSGGFWVYKSVKR